MKFFIAFCEIENKWDAVPREKDYLYDVFGKEILLSPFNIDNSHLLKTVEDTQVFGISAVCMDIRTNSETVEAFIVRACEFWRMPKLLGVRIKESTFKECIDSRFSRSKDTILRAINLFELHAFLCEERFFWEKLLFEPYEKAVASSQAKRTKYARSLKVELDRVYKETPLYPGGHPPLLPVHYLIEGSNPAQYEPVIETLLSSLLYTKRLTSKHLFFFDIDKAEKGYYQNWGRYGILGSINESFAEALRGNTLIIKYGLNDNDASYDEYAYKALKKVLSILNPFHNDVQLLFVVPPKKPSLKKRLRKYFSSPLIELQQDEQPSAINSNFDTSLRYLTKLAQDYGVNVDEDLGSLLKDRLLDKSFDDLEGLFSEWRQAKLSREYFPQYQESILHAFHLRQSNQPASALQRLDELIGLSEIKQRIKTILPRFRMNKEIERAGLPVQPFSLHMAFLGAPGTGKTEVARLYGEILKEEGVLSEGRVIIVSGGTYWDIEETCDAAKGSVLFIDEAYGLLGRSDNAVTELLAQMENHREEIVVIFAGYKNETDRLFDSNPGFRSRLGYTIEFPDYSTNELLEIFKLMCKRAELILPEDTTSTARDILERGGRRDDQGNARFVRKLFEDAIGAQQTRLALTKPNGGRFRKKSLQTILPKDLGYVLPCSHKRSARQDLIDLVGLQDAKKLVSDRLTCAQMQKVKRDAGIKTSFTPMHMAFKGNPGSGKTEVARLVGRILKEEGVLSVGDFFECGRQDLVGQAVGHTAIKVEGLFRKAKGSVIFIDEAYSLNDEISGGFGEEAIITIVDLMEKMREDVVVIFAGYTREIDDLFAQNPGFRSRVGLQVVFPDYSVDELLQILELMARKEKLRIGRGVKTKVKGILNQASKQKGFGNARFVRTLLEGAVVAQSVRLSSLMEERLSAARTGLDNKGISDDLSDSVEVLSKKELNTLLPEDFYWDTTPNNKLPVGFVST